MIIIIGCRVAPPSVMKTLVSARASAQLLCWLVTFAVSTLVAKVNTDLHRRPTQVHHWVAPYPVWDHAAGISIVMSSTSAAAATYSQ